MQSRPSRLGCLSSGAIAAAVVVVVVVGGIVLFGGSGLFSPGPLSAQAAFRPDLGASSHADITDCAECHPAPWSGVSLSDRCLACHTDVEQDPKNFHAIMFAHGQPSACQNCHTEHRGAGATLTLVMDANIFSHARLGYSLQAHAKMADGTPFQCTGCHTNGYAGAFDQAVCASCHSTLDAAFMAGHAQAFGLDCLACHDGVDSYGRAFDHTRVAFSLTGKHKTVPCAQCHSGARNLADLKATAQACNACHAKDDAHQGGLGQDCGHCHTPDGWKLATIDHSQTAFPLIGKHQSVACQACHVNVVFKGTPTDCAACHLKDDVHQGDFGQDCGQCHTPVDWQEASIDHAQTRFPLIGMHATVPCLHCHVDNIFKGTPTNCAACHSKDDAHQGDLGQTCETCHNPVSWFMATMDHNLAAFKLIGKHQTVPCESCHVNNVFKGTPKDCYSCHAKDDAHKGTLGSDCSICHSPAGWLPSTFNHALTIFPLTGAHASVACSRCHVSGPIGIMFKGTPTICSACHADPAYHAGLFGLGCASCHSTAGWIPAQFNLSHNFDLNHGGASSCQDCHPTTLRTYTCTKCHPGGAPPGDTGGG